MSNHKLTVANLCVKSNSMWTNFADNGKIHTCMYNVCTMYTTAVGVILPRQLACCLHRNEYDIWCNVCWTLHVRCMYVACTLYVRAMKVSQWLTGVYRERWFAEVLSASCSRETVSGEMLAGKRSVRFAHTAHASLMGAYAPKRSANRALSWEKRAFRVCAVNS